MDKLEGMIENIVFRNDETGFTVMEIDADGTIETATGTLPPFGEGERVRLGGAWINHSTYGRQLKVESAQQLPPDSKEGLLRYLSSGLIKGVGPSTAGKIVKAFGEDTLEIVRNSPERLREVEGIGKAKAVIIANTLSEHIKMQDNMIYLQSLAIPLNLAAKICNEYGIKTKTVVENYPYRLASQVDGIGFLRADRIARQIGYDIDSQERLVAGISYTLSEAARQDGHTCLPVDALINKAKSILYCSEELLNDAIIKAISNRDVVLREYKDIEYLYLPLYDSAEREVGARLMSLIGQDLPNIGIDIDEASQILIKMQGIELSTQQKDAVESALSTGVTIITGGPGTGKTTTINSLIWALEQVKYKIILGAPTGRAAKRMSEATGKESKTLHRILEYGYSEDDSNLRFNVNDENQLDCDAIIVDEMSMVDIILMQHLLRAIPNNARLIMVGDADQLPSVGAGNVLADIIKSGFAKVAHLDEIFRQAQESLIVTNAHKINNGEMPTLNNRKSDFFFLEKQNATNVLSTVMAMAKERIPNFLHCDPLKDIQILSPVKKGELGVINLNKELQQAFNPKDKFKNEKVVGENIFRVGDKIMQIKNNYRIKWSKKLSNGAIYDGEGVFNGDTGFIVDIDFMEKTLRVDFDDEKTVDYTFNELDELNLAYSVTIHKSQGSEYDVVIMPLFSGPPMLMTRNLLYTAVTRGKKMVVVVGRKEMLSSMIGNDMLTSRHSCLIQVLEEHI